MFCYSCVYSQPHREENGCGIVGCLCTSRLLNIAHHWHDDAVAAQQLGVEHLHLGLRHGPVIGEEEEAEKEEEEEEEEGEEALPF